MFYLVDLFVISEAEHGEIVALLGIAYKGMDGFRHPLYQCLRRQLSLIHYCNGKRLSRFLRTKLGVFYELAEDYPLNIDNF